MLNISKYDDNSTARTQKICAAQRAENLACLGVNSVLELCVGPSLKILEQEYLKVGITKIVGNDIDPRWKNYYPRGNWIIGDATKIDTRGFDAVVFAPPLSRGCSGKREDSLNINNILPSYNYFLNLPNKITVLVLPGRTLSIKQDRTELYQLLNKIKNKVEIVPLKNKVIKYLDIYIIK